MNIAWFLAIIALIIICIIVYQGTKLLTPNHYMFNTYMHILLGIIVIGLTWVITDDLIKDTEFEISGYQLLALLAIAFVSILIIFFVNNTIISHMVWFLFVVCIALISFPFYEENKTKGTILPLFISLLLLVAIFAYIAYSHPLDVIKTWYIPLIVIIIGLTLVQLIDYIFFFNKKEVFVSKARIYTWLDLAFLSGFLLFDAERSSDRAHRFAELCITEDLHDCSNYPKASLAIFFGYIEFIG